MFRELVCIFPVILTPRNEQRGEFENSEGPNFKYKVPKMYSILQGLRDTMNYRDMSTVKKIDFMARDGTVGVGEETGVY